MRETQPVAGIRFQREITRHGATWSLCVTESTAAPSEFRPGSKANWRGHVATFAIRNGVLVVDK